ncbi:MAG: DUF4157 domain-containing protein [Paracoccaceae bacterium]
MTEGEVTYGEKFLTRNLIFEEVKFSGQEARGIRQAERQLASEAEQLLTTTDGQDRADKLASSLPALFGAAAITVGNTIFYDQDVYSADFSVSIFDSDRWLMAHELTHVWQWQNRAITGYSFSKVVSEHLEFGDDVYDYTLVEGKRFTEYRFEQQGEIVECYAMLRQLRPNDPVTLKHERLIRAEFPLDTMLKLIDPNSNEVIRVRAGTATDAC